MLGAQADLGPAEMLQFFRIIDEQADHMGGLVGALLDAAGCTETDAAPGPAAPPAGRSGMRIVVVHDDPETRRYVRDALAAAGTRRWEGDPRRAARVADREARLVCFDFMRRGRRHRADAARRRAG